MAPTKDIPSKALRPTGFKYSTLLKRHRKPHPPQNIRFYGFTDPLSNLFMTKISIWDKTFFSVEHGYQYRKAIFSQDYILAKSIEKSESAMEARKLGKLLTQSPEWLSRRVNIMEELLKAKFDQCFEFRRALAYSLGCKLIEETQHDFWGNGKLGNGKNMLGHLLMNLRDSTWPTLRDSAWSCVSTANGSSSTVCAETSL